MTAFDRFDRRFGDALEDLASPHVPEYFEDVLSTAMRHPQRPAWTFLERWIPVSTLTRRSVLVPGIPWRTVGILLALLALLVAGAVVSLGLWSDRTPAPPFGPAANGLIFYASDGDIYSRNLESGGEEILIGGAERDVSPLLSRDGLSLAWFRLEPSEADGATLMVANADGTATRALLGPIAIDSAAWSPSSDELALISSAAGSERTLSIVPVARGAEARVLDLPVTPAGAVEWRPPDGRELIFRAPAGAGSGIYAVAPDGSGFREVATSGNIDGFWDPYQITPDGSRMFYTRGDQIQLAILDLETGEQRPFGAELPPPPDYDGGLQYHGTPSISPDGETLLFGRYWNESDGMINHQLYAASVDGDGADAVALGPVHRSQSGHNPFWQAYSPDGEVILIAENDTFQAWTVHPDGTGRDALELRELGDPPAWQRVAP